MLWLKFYGPGGVHHALLHDFHEYITGDIPSPIKQCLNGGMKALEQHLDLAIYNSLEVILPDADEHRKVKVVDFAALMVESVFFGTPGTTERVMQIDYPKLPVDFRDEVFRCIFDSFPEQAQDLVNYYGWDARDAVEQP
jgi:hypothetical protein